MFRLAIIGGDNYMFPNMGGDMSAHARHTTETTKHLPIFGGPLSETDMCQNNLSSKRTGLCLPLRTLYLVVSQR